MRLPLAIVVSAILFFSCEEKKKVTNKFSNQELINIHELADHRNAEALLPYLDSPDEALRIEAFEVMASVQDTIALGILQNHLITDPSSEVRKRAAYALGQIAHAESMSVLMQSAESDSSDIVRGYALEALGKTGASVFKSNPELTDKAIAFLDKIRFHNDDEREGWGKATMRLHMAGVTNDALMNRMAFVLQLTNRDARIACAYSMARYKGEDWFNEATNMKYIKNWCRMERDYEVRIPQMTLLGKLHDNESLEILKGFLSESQNEMVQVAAIRAARQRTDVKTSDLFPALSFVSEHAVLEAITAIGQKSLDAASKPTFDVVSKRSVAIQAAMLKLLSTTDPSISAKIHAGLDSTTGDYNKVHYAHALGGIASEAKFCAEKAIQENSLPLKYAFTEAFLECASSALGNAEQLQLSESLFNTGDIGVQALIAQAWRGIQPGDADKAKLSGAMKSRLASLKLPAEVETYNEIVSTLNEWNGEKTEAYVPTFNHPINWELVAGLQKSTTVKVKTTRGDFEIELDPESSPGSVASFLQLVNDGFFNDKFFHRVVPNFVIQGGCPRGDGMGSTDYTIRSEFGLHHYRPGAVGLASSGKDTESCQWFVTNTFAPHLEGRYTIIGYVTVGMEVVNSIQVGDQIQQVLLQENKPKKK